MKTKLVRKLTLFILLFICTLLLTSCNLGKPSWSSFTKITYQDLLSKNHDYYYVIFYSPDCIYCEDILPVAFEYAQDDTNYPIYVLNVDDIKHNEGIMASEGYQYTSFIGTSNYADIVLENVPAFISVDHGTVEMLISSQTTDRPKSEIINWLQN